MKKLLFGTFLLALLFSFPLSTMAEVSVNIGFSIPLPPVIQYREPPTMVVLPHTYTYVAPGVDVDIFFNDGWWWRPYQGRWYRSRHYNSGWVYQRQPPSFYIEVPRHWRDDYRKHQWKGRRWNPERRDYHEVQKNWNHWKKNRHWEKNNNWGVQKAQHNQNEQRQYQPTDRGKYDRNDRNDRHEKHDKHDKHGKNGHY